MSELRREFADSENDQHEVDIIWQNIFESSDFTTWRKTSQRSVRELLIDFTTLVEEGYLEVINLSMSRSSFVVVVICKKDWLDA